MDAVGELVAAAVVDERVWRTQGEVAPDGIYLTGQPGPALPFVLFRAWKVPVGFVREEVRLFGPSGRMIHRWGPVVRRMAGQFDLTTEVDVVDDAVFDETGTYVASFIIDDQVVGEIDLPVYVQAAAATLPKDTEDGLKRSDVIWLSAKVDGRQVSAPVWFAYRNGLIYTLSQREPGPQEQTVPGVGAVREYTVTTRRKGRDTSLQEFTAAPRVLEGPEWEAAAALLVDKRKSRGGPPNESLTRWRSGCDILELTPNVPPEG
jgi:hypothetical protein